MLRPVICDAFGNFTTLQNDDLSIVIAMADGSQNGELEPEEVARSGMTAYEARFEPKVQGQYVVHVCPAGIPIKGSPTHVNVRAGTRTLARVRSSFQRASYGRNTKAKYLHTTSLWLRWINMATSARMAVLTHVPLRWIERSARP